MRNARAPHNSIWRQLLTLYVVAVTVNYLWELAQSPLYVGMERLSLVWWHCLLASLGDGFLVLLIFAAGCLTLRSLYWFVRPGAKEYALMLAVGLVIGVGVEWMALHFTRQWSYTSRMPLLPTVKVGITPVVQMLVLPPIIFRLVVKWNRYK
jgi:hypothetical protein